MNANNILTEADEYEVLKLKLSGMRQHDIAVKFDVSDSTIQRILKRQLSSYRDTNIKEINEMVNIEEARLDEMYKALQPRIERGEPRAIEMGIKISERRARMLDLDSAQKLELSGSIVNIVVEDMGDDRGRV